MSRNLVASRVVGVASMVVAAICGNRLAAQTAPPPTVAIHEDSIVTADSVKLYYRVVGSAARR